MALLDRGAAFVNGFIAMSKLMVANLSISSATDCLGPQPNLRIGMPERRFDTIKHQDERPHHRHGRMVHFRKACNQARPEGGGQSDLERNCADNHYPPNLSINRPASLSGCYADQ
jgi:hypothetical protein